MPTPESLQRSGRLSLSVVIPVRNKRYVIEEALRRVTAVREAGVTDMEVIVVDDASTDGTSDVLARILETADRWIKVVAHEESRGPGAALRTGIRAAGGDLIAFLDSDLEYDPRDLLPMIRCFLEDGADVVYGSRFLAGDRRRVLPFRRSVGNRFRSLVSNWFTDLDLTDVETACKAFRAPLLKSIPIRSDGPHFHVELIAKIAKRQLRLFEVPVSYLGHESHGRSERSLVKAIATILYYWLKDDIYAEDEYGSHILHSLERTRRFNRWMAKTVASQVGEGSRILEIGAGIGNMTSYLQPRDLYVASDINPNYLHYLRNYAYGKPYLKVDRIDLQDPECFEPWLGRFDTVICLNVLEHVNDPVLALRNMLTVLEPGGRLVLYVPQGQWLFSSLDEVLEHRCRYDRASLMAELAEAGFSFEACQEFNRCSVPGWWWNGKVLKRRGFSRIQLKAFDLLNPLLRRIDRFFPWPGLGLIATATRPKTS